jgi:hypothetical protein
MAATTALPAAGAAPHEHAAARPSRLAALRADRYRTLQLVLFAIGAVLMPFGILAIALGWYGTAHAHYDYDQRTYLISGGIMGLGLTFLGGFLYFGAWLAKVSADQRDSARQLSEALAVLAGALDRMAPRAADLSLEAAHSAELVVAGDGTTVHRRDCPLIAYRDDLRPLFGSGDDLTTCRVCRPDFD